MGEDDEIIELSEDIISAGLITELEGALEM